MHVYVRPFEVKSNTANLAVTTASQTVALNRAGIGTQSIRVVNIGTQTVFISIGGSGVTASLTTSMPILANTVETLTIQNEDTTVAAIASATGSTIYVTTGESA
jgi:hypothetical protein